MLKCPINLLDHQDQHVKKIWKLLVKEKVFSFIDTSKMGLGKTITTLYIAWHLQKKYGTKVFIAAPSDSSLMNDDGWLAHAKNFGIEIMHATTYPGIRGGQGKVSHPWLIPDPEDKKKWVASKEFEYECATGLFLIFDEFHNTKNPSITHFACAALVKAAKKYRKVCRVALLSHTPGDLPKVYPQLLRMTGLITSTKLFKYIPFTRDYRWENYGLGELARVCSKAAKNPDAISEIRESMEKISAKRSHGICKDLYTKHIKSIITFAMPKPPQEYEVEMLNAFLETDPHSLTFLEDGLNLLKGAVGWDPILQQVAEHKQWKIGNIPPAMMLIEKGKLLSIASYVIKKSKENSNKKFVILCGSRNIKHHDILRSLLYKNYVPDSFKNFLFELKRTHPLWAKLPKDMINCILKYCKVNVRPDKLNSQVKKEDRVKVLRNFQADSNDSWCLIASPGTGSESISLHDKYGNHPREILTVPDYWFGRVVQSTGRIDRVGTKSDSKIMITYSKQADLETSILNSMIRKSKNSRDLLADGQEVVLPGEYDFWIEGERDLSLEGRLRELRNQ